LYFLAANPDTAEFITPKRKLACKEGSVKFVQLSKIDCASTEVISVQGLITNKGLLLEYGPKDGREGGKFITFDITDNEG
jgi:hypothetical protein